jgi:hypothetical protein
MPALLRHYALPTVIRQEVIRATLRDIATSRKDHELIGKFFEHIFDLTHEGKFLHITIYINKKAKKGVKKKSHELPPRHRSLPKDLE